MRNKTRKFIWSAPLVAALAIIGALTLAGVLLLPNADTTEAQEQIPVPGAPTAVTSAAANMGLNITWDAPAVVGGGLTGYQIQHTLGTDTTFANATMLTASAAATGYNIRGLANGTAYLVRVRATNAQGEGDWGVATGTLTPAAVEPGPPQNVRAMQTSVDTSADPNTATIVVRWDAPADNGGAELNASPYAVTVDPAGPTVGTIDHDDREVEVTGATLGTTYTFEVTAANEVGTGTAGEGMVTTRTAVSLSTLDFGGMVSDIDSTSGGAGINITIQVNNLTAGLPPGSSIVLILEDDYQVPSSIPASSIIFQGTGTNADADFNTGAVPASVSPTVKTGAYVNADKKDYAIRIRVPDFCSGDNTCGLDASQDLTLVVSSAAGIKNPTEAGTHSTYVDVIGPVDELKGASAIRGMTKTDFMTVAKIGLSSVDGGRGDELTVTGSGFNNGTSAGVFVLSDGSMPADCPALIANPKRTRVGSGTVGSDDKVAITFEVTVPTFKPGGMNYICMADGEGRTSGTDVEDFSLDPSIRVSPSTANVGDTVTIFAEDFVSHAGGPITLASRPTGSSAPGISAGGDGSGTATFEVPGWAEGTLRVDAWGENTKITVIGSQLSVSKASALPNELLTITGDGFSTGSDHYIDAEKVTIDGVPLEVHEDSLNRDGEIDISNSGQFVATVVLWPADDGTNPTLTAGVHTIKVEDSAGFSGTATVSIPEPMVKLTPNIAGPRDVISISGENWPVDNIEGSTPPTVMIDVEDGRPRTYSALPDSAGRWFVEHRVSGAVAIPSTNRVTAKVGSEIVKVVTFQVPAAIIDVSPGEGQPGDTISLMVDKMPVYAAVDSIQIAGRDVLPVGNFSTDRTGAVTVEGVVIPGLDPGTYSVLMDIDDTVAIGSVNVLAEVVGTDTPTADALEPLGDSLAAAFYFDNVTKTWSFYDPRPEFADLNTLDNLVNGEAYWVLVSEDVDDVVLNNKSRSLTCSGGDCWNLVIW